jgi:hypothetical protein
MHWYRRFSGQGVDARLRRAAFPATPARFMSGFRFFGRHGDITAYFYSVSGFVRRACSCADLRVAHIRVSACMACNLRSNSKTGGAKKNSNICNITVENPRYPRRYWGFMRIYKCNFLVTWK